MKDLSSRITATMSGNTLTVCPKGEIDHHSARTLRERIDNELYQNRPHRMILDLSSIDFMDSSGLGLLLGRYQKAKELGCELTLTGLSDRTKRILALAGADRLFNIK